MVQGAEQVGNPITKFKEGGFPEYLLQTINNEKYSAPTPIQAQGWPIALSGDKYYITTSNLLLYKIVLEIEIFSLLPCLPTGNVLIDKLNLGKDLVAIARTGSGKTFGYLLPAIIHTMNQEYLEKGDGPIVLVMAPTRELAQQIQVQSVKFGEPCKLKTACLFGGAPKGRQIGELERGVEICVATPGRLIDILEVSVCPSTRLYRPGMRIRFWPRKRIRGSVPQTNL